MLSSGITSDSSTAVSDSDSVKEYNPSMHSPPQQQVTVKIHEAPDYPKIQIQDMDSPKHRYRKASAGDSRSDVSEPTTPTRGWRMGSSEPTRDKDVGVAGTTGTKGTPQLLKFTRIDSTKRNEIAERVSIISVF